MGTWNGRRALIFSGGPEMEYDYIHAFLQEGEPPVCICADGGLRHARAVGIVPDLVIGDFDSGVPDGLTCEIIRLQTAKDDTDTQHCVAEAMSRGCCDMTIVCASGGRLDHLLANLLLLEMAEAKGCSCVLLDRQNRAMLVSTGKREYILPRQYQYFSLIPLDAVLEGVTLQNVKYPLQKARVTRIAPITLSNEAPDGPFTVEILRGKALLVFSADAS